QALADLGWTDGRNVRVDVRWHGDDINRTRAAAQELGALQPDIILTEGTAATVLLQRETRTIPIVFVNRRPTHHVCAGTRRGTGRDTQSRTRTVRYFTRVH